MSILANISNARNPNIIRPWVKVIGDRNPESLFENCFYCGRLRLPMAASAAKMGLQRRSATISAPFFSFLAIESLARPRDEAIFKQALNNPIAYGSRHLSYEFALLDDFTNKAPPVFLKQGHIHFLYHRKDFFMSIESAKAFIERLKVDEDFRTSYANNKDQAIFIKTAGFDFSDDEMAQIKDELSDDDLLNIAGGGFDCPVLHSCGTAGNCGTDCHSDCSHDCTGHVNVDPTIAG